MSDLRARVEAALDEVVDPCSAGIGRPAGLVTMGLLKSLDIHPGPNGARVAITLRLTSPCCMMGPRFAMNAEAKLKQLPDVGVVEISISTEIDWEPRHMRQDYRESLPRPHFMGSFEP
jgi:metal-sulfur cluster biosynthetic enzyme